jgi:hypothetical protein
MNANLPATCLPVGARTRQKHQESNYDKSIRGHAFVVDDLVLLHCPHVPRGRSRKLHRPWQGPYKVVSLLGPATYRIMNCVRTIKPLVVHFNRLKPCVSNENIMDCVPIQKVPEVIPTCRTAVPLNSTTTGDKMEDTEVYLPQQQGNPLPLAPTVEEDYTT